MEWKFVSKNIYVVCRICLTTSKSLYELTAPFDENVDSWTIYEMLESVTFKKIVLDDEKFPSKICRMCLSLLRISYDFQRQFMNSQNILKKIMNKTAIENLRKLEKEVEEEKLSEKSRKPPPASVELICGDGKFDLKDILVIEEEEEEKATYEGFLNNLGTEISAKFVGEQNTSKQRKDKPQNNLAIEPLNRHRSSEKSQAREEQISSDTKAFGDANTLEKTLYRCRRCNTLFQTNGKLEMHVEMCYGPPTQFMCDKCGHIANTQSALYHHLQTHKGKRFRCDQCDKAYNTVTRLKVHLEVHKNERPYLCNVCGKNFNYKVALKYHMRLHTGEKKYVCNFCGRNFAMSNTLKRHLRTHTKDKPYKCSHCEKAFSSRGELKCHEMYHTGQAPYQCEYCEKAFTKSSTLHYHSMSHSGAHECSFCPKTFIDVKFLRTHLRRAHEEMKDDGEIENIS